MILVDLVDESTSKSSAYSIIKRKLAEKVCGFCNYNKDSYDLSSECVISRASGRHQQRHQSRLLLISP
jgi:hypothetical protein